MINDITTFKKDRLKVRDQAAGCSGLRPQGKGDEVQPSGGQAIGGVRIDQAAVGGSSDFPAGAFGDLQHVEKSGMKERLSPPLQIHQPGFFKSRRHGLEKGQGHVIGQPLPPPGMVGAVQAVAVAAGSDFDLDSVQTGRKGVSPFG